MLSRAKRRLTVESADWKVNFKVTFLNASWYYNAQGESQRAINYLQQSLEISQQIGTHDVEAESWFNLGDTRKNLQQKSEAKTAYENARELYQAMGLDKKVEECDKAIQDLENDDND